MRRLIAAFVFALFGSVAYAQELPIIDPLYEPAGTTAAKIDHDADNAVAWPDGADRSAAATSWLVVTVADDGSVSDVAVSRAGEQMFDDAAIASVRHWHFLPATRNGQNIASRRHLAVLFRPN